jgi:transposase
MDKQKDTKLQKMAVWGERKFCRMVVRIGMLLRGCFGKAPANITDEAIDEALTARDEIIKRNAQRGQGTAANHLSFRSGKALRQTITIRAQNFAKTPWNRFYVSSLHTSEMLSYPNCLKPFISTHEDERTLWPLHFEKKRKKNKWPLPLPHRITNDCKLTYSWKTNDWTFAWVYETQKRPRETQADGSILHAVAIDPGIRTPFTWYSPTKGVGKIGQHDMGRIARLCQHTDNLISRKDKLAASNSRRKQRKARRLAAAVARMQRKLLRLRTEIHRKAAAFFAREFDAIIVPPFAVSGMVNRKTRKISRGTVRKMLCWGHHRFRQRLISKAEELSARVIIQNEAYTSKTCSWCGNIQNIGGSKLYKCRGCGVVMDRDENGARGIFLRALLDGALVLL